MLVKTEPRESHLPSSQATSSYDNTTVQEQPLAMYQEEEEYEQVGDEQVYTEDTSSRLPDGTGKYVHYHQFSVSVFCVFNRM